MKSPHELNVVDIRRFELYTRVGISHVALEGGYEALYNTDIYDRLKSSIDRLEKWKYIQSSGKVIPDNVSDYNKALDELWAVILKMTNLIYKPRFFGHFIGVKLKI